MPADPRSRARSRFALITTGLGLLMAVPAGIAQPAQASSVASPPLVTSAAVMHAAVASARVAAAQVSHVPSSTTARPPVPHRVVLPKIQTPKLAVARACQMTGGVAVAFTLTQTGAEIGTDASGAVNQVVPAVYLIHEASRNTYTDRDFMAARVGGAIRSRAALLGTFTLGQTLTLSAHADDPGTRTYDPDSPPVTIAVTACRVSPEAWFAAAPGKTAHSVELSAAESIGNGLTYTWAVRTVTDTKPVPAANVPGSKSRKAITWTTIGSGVALSHTFPAAGSAVVRLTVTDATQHSAKLVKTITVQ